MMDPVDVGGGRCHGNNRLLKSLRVRIKNLYCYDCSRTFFTSDAFEFHAHDDEYCTSDDSDDTSDTSDSEEEEEEVEEKPMILHEGSKSPALKKIKIESTQEGSSSASSSDSSSSSTSSESTDSSSSDENSGSSSSSSSSSSATAQVKTEDIKPIIRPGEPYFICYVESCNKLGFENYGAMRRHMRTIHPELEPVETPEEREARRNYMCEEPYCGKRFLTSSHLADHKLSHLGTPGEFRCTFQGCTRSFHRQWKLTKHQKETQHNPDSSRYTNEDVAALTCPICSKKLKNKKNLKDHIRLTHDPETSRRYKCPAVECDRAFPTLSYRRDHYMRIHAAEKNILCQHCPKQFSHPSSLQKHIKFVHEGSRPHLCHLCPRRFPTAAKLTHHVRVNHEGQADYLCTICGKSLTTRNNLERHILAHTPGYKPCVCPFSVVGCPAAYTQSPSLKKHIEKHHQGQQLPPKETLVPSSFYTAVDNVLSEVGQQ